MQTDHRLRLHRVRGETTGDQNRVDGSLSRLQELVETARARRDGGLVRQHASIFDTRDCEAFSCVNEADGTDGLCSHCRGWNAHHHVPEVRLPLRPERGKGSRQVDILEAMRAGELTRTQLLGRASKRQLDSALRRLRDAGVIQRVGKGRYVLTEDGSRSVRSSGNVSDLPLDVWREAVENIVKEAA